MANTGLKDIMKAAFGGVPSMLSGKKFLQNARSLRIVVEELILCTVKNIRAEREADWPLHLHVVKEMLPYIFAAGHQN